VVRVSPPNNKTVGFPNLQKLSDKKLISLLASPSAVRRLHVQREILRRQPRSNFVNQLGDLALSSHELPVRAAAVFTLGQIESPDAAILLVKLLDEADLRAFVLRVLVESKIRAEKLPAKIFLTALEDKNPTVRLQAIIALNRLRQIESADNIFPLTSTDPAKLHAAFRNLVSTYIFPFITDADPAIAHTAFRALVSYGAADVNFKALDFSTDYSTPSVAHPALRVLGNLHETAVVDGLIKRLENSGTLRPAILETLCRLYHREADWDGAWWTTRPDISGPYYKSTKWDGTEKIVAVLRDELAKSDAEKTQFLLALFKKYKIESPAKDSSPLQQPKITFVPNETQPITAAAPLSENSIAKLPYEEVVKRVSAASGDAKAGAKFFETAGCVKCHTTTKGESPKGPFLGDIVARYNDAEILESILRPSAKIAQGFETTAIENKDGDSFDGFVVRESGDEVELRNIVGATIIPKKNIAVRGTRATSIMPDGLVDALSPEDLASMLRYLQSLKPKS
ncbi:MAG: c-type cytochrome, partial [Verrucomicrobiota bacterium]